MSLAILDSENVKLFMHLLKRILLGKETICSQRDVFERKQEVTKIVSFVKMMKNLPKA